MHQAAGFTGGLMRYEKRLVFQYKNIPLRKERYVSVKERRNDTKTYGKTPK